MILTKDKCDLALHSIYECANNCDVAYVGSKNSKCNREFYILDDLIKEHFELLGVLKDCGWEKLTPARK